MSERVRNLIDRSRDSHTDDSRLKLLGEILTAKAEQVNELVNLLKASGYQSL